MKQLQSMWSAEATSALLARLGIAAPRSCVVDADADLDAALDFLAPATQFVAKTAAALSHRANVGGVVLGLSSRGEVRAAVDLLRIRFDAPVLLVEQIEHEASFFVGLQARGDGRVMLAFRAGVATDESDIALRLCPLAPADAEQLVATADVSGVAAQALVDVLVQVAAIPEYDRTLSVLDMNPLVLSSRTAGASRLVALDVKAYGTSERTER